MSPKSSSGFWDTYRGPASDPRTIVTPDAFEVHPDLLGLPLAQHHKRVVAMLVDLLLVAIVTQAGGLLLGILAAAFLIRVTFRKRDARAPSLMGTAFRGVVGCFGAVILLVTVIVFLGALLGRSDRGDVRETATRDAPEGVRTLDIGDLGRWDAVALTVLSVRDAQRFRQAEDEAEAVRIANVLAERARAVGLTLDEVREGLLEIAPPAAPWRGAIGTWELDAFADERDAEPGAGGTEAEAAARAEGDPERDPAADPDTASDPMSDPDAMPDFDPAADLALPPQLADTLRVLHERLEEESRRRARAERATDALSAELHGARRDAGSIPGIRAFLRRVAEDLGLGFGWAALYFTVFTTWWKGRTPGKRLMRLRVVRLSGAPLTWWDSFERYGGYAAGFATGLLGFAQVYWDPNRQAIHDRIGRTVVVQDEKPPVPGRWKATAHSPPAGPGPKPGQPVEPPRSDHS